MQAGAPADDAVGAARLTTLREMSSRMTRKERATIWSDPALLEKARTFVGTDEYGALLASLGMYTKAKTASGVEHRLHMTARQAVRSIEYAFVSTSSSQAISQDRGQDRGLLRSRWRR